MLTRHCPSLPWTTSIRQFEGKVHSKSLPTHSRNVFSPSDGEQGHMSDDDGLVPSGREDLNQVCNENNDPDAKGWSSG